MVSYLVALVVSDFVCLNTTVDGIDVYVCAPPILEYKLDYAFWASPELLHIYAKQYFQLDYQLPKAHFVAIPDFSAGAMENWGLILYRYAALLYHNDEDTSTGKAYVNAVDAHEIVHMVCYYN